ncbi:MAG: phosphatase PAP2 family protein [Kineosporiaceae bacterium]
MTLLQPSWQLSVVTAAALAVLAFAGRRSRSPRRCTAAAFGQEFAIVMSLLAVWQLVGSLVHTRQAGASERARDILALERSLHLVNEVDVQRLVLPHPWLVEGVDRFYAYAHLNGMAVFLVLMWWWRREVYPALRLTVVLSTLACLLVQIVPVAPPRLLPGLGFVDTALLRGESVYGPYGTGLSNQLSAMPSVHVAWACIVAWYLWWNTGPRIRWIGPTHLTLTVFAVVASANHWWLDGFVAAGFVALAIAGGRMTPWRTVRASPPRSRSGSSSPRGLVPSASSPASSSPAAGS